MTAARFASKAARAVWNLGIGARSRRLRGLRRETSRWRHHLKNARDCQEQIRNKVDIWRGLEGLRYRRLRAKKVSIRETGPDRGRAETALANTALPRGKGSAKGAAVAVSDGRAGELPSLRRRPARPRPLLGVGDGAGSRTVNGLQSIGSRFVHSSCAHCEKVGFDGVTAFATY